jgi:hypothetical protein
MIIGVVRNLNHCILFQKEFCGIILVHWIIDKRQKKRLPVNRPRRALGRGPVKRRLLGRPRDTATRANSVAHRQVGPTCQLHLPQFARLGRTEASSGDGCRRLEAPFPVFGTSTRSGERTASSGGGNGRRGEQNRQRRASRRTAASGERGVSPVGNLW